MENRCAHIVGRFLAGGRLMLGHSTHYPSGGALPELASRMNGHGLEGNFTRPRQRRGGRRTKAESPGSASAIRAGTPSERIAQLRQRDRIQGCGSAGFANGYAIGELPGEPFSTRDGGMVSELCCIVLT